MEDFDLFLYTHRSFSYIVMNELDNVARNVNT